MDVNANYTQAIEAAETARAKAAAAKASAAKEAKDAEEADAAVERANNKVTEQESRYTLANTRVTAKQAELNSAVARLNALAGSKDEGAINAAQAAVDNIRAELEEIKKEAEKEYQELVKTQQDAQTALKRAEIEKQEAELAQKELEEAEAELEAAEAEAESAKEAKEAEEAKLANEVSQLTEAEAIEQGYTIVKTPDDLKAMAKNLSGKYILMGDIDLSGIEWEPIGKMDPNAENPWENAFSGVLNGNGYSIKNLTIKADGEDDTNAIGLFGATKDAQISDLKLEDINVSAPEDYNEIAVGGLIGISSDTNLDNITVTGNITGHQGVGGLIGCTQDSQGIGKVSVTNINSDVNVNASYYAGGLIGKVGSTIHNSLVLENCHTSGNINIKDQAAGGLIGEAGKTVITVNNCSSSMDITKENEEDTGLSWLLDDTSRIGGIIGNCNGTYISICNSQYTGTLTCDDEFKGENYGWYMNDAQVSIFELSAGLPVDDILNIEGVEALTPTVDSSTGVAHYEVTVSTLAGMNRLVDMVESNPKLANIITFNIQFDFETMDETYDTTAYNQYGVVQHLYEDSNGEVVNDVYIDNEIDLESTFNTGFVEADIIALPEFGPKETMVKGLYKDEEGKYYICTGETGGKYDGFSEVTLQFFFENQHTIVDKRLDSDEVMLREYFVAETYSYQERIQDILKERYGLNEDALVPIIQEPEYKALKKKEAAGKELSQEEKLKIAVFELNYTIMNIVGEITKNEGCGMGGDSSFLEKDKGIPLEDEYGRVRYMALDGFEVRQKVDENGENMFDENGNPLYETLEGEDYDGSHGSVYVVRGFAVTDEDGNFLYTDKEGKTVVRSEAEDGTYTYAYEDGTAYEDDAEALTQQLEEYSPKDMNDDLTEQLTALEDLYKNGGAVDVTKENNGLPEPEKKKEEV